MKKPYHRNKQWFVDRIGKRIYRKPLKCKCVHCRKDYVDIHNGISKEGVRLYSKEQHADYLFMVHNELGVQYFDKPIKKETMHIVQKD